MSTPKKKPPVSSRPRSLVTGACGFIGSHVVEKLREAGHYVIASDHPSGWQKDDLVTGRYPTLVRGWADEVHEFDLTDPGSVDTLPGNLDYVFHLAAIFSYSATLESLRRVNVEGTRNLLEHALKTSPSLKRWVQWGAGGVYGAPSERKVPVFSEDLAPQPGNDYLRSKWEQEFLVMDYGKRGLLEYTIVRPTTVFGPRGGYGARQMFAAPIGMPVVVIPANFTGRIPFIHVEDVALAAIYLAGCGDAANEVFNLNDDTIMNNVEFMKALARILGKPFFRLPPVPYRQLISGALPVLWGVFHLTRDVLKVKPPLEPAIISYLKEDWSYSNEKLHRVGYRFKYPDARLAFESTLRWYQTEGQI
ncbi:MAG: NAD(P)-dependent oxidoreductase [Deltaproteobacteria bacterium]|nr:NAD(P)-dependent oxidoreductase [Deltaproteobacteria bacterium]